MRPGSSVPKVVAKVTFSNATRFHLFVRFSVSKFDFAILRVSTATLSPIAFIFRTWDDQQCHTT